jgi:16S rRNA (adenine1518-N6/adenine1519-N6)-dimethyltransferase
VHRPPLGQHFLNRPDTLARIAEAACPEPEPLLIEIGPGQGSLTALLLERARRVVAIEFDPSLVERLRLRFAHQAHLEVVHADVLQTDLAQWGPAVVAGNLPFYITSPILDRVLSLGPLLRRAVFLVQREVAERLVAPPGGRDYGFLSVRTQFFARPRILFGVPASAFQPPPKVDSAVVVLDPHPPALADPASFLAFAGRCFQHKRKTLRNNLAALYPRITGSLEASLRAEQLSLDQLVDLHRRLTERVSP